MKTNSMEEVINDVMKKDNVNNVAKANAIMEVIVNRALRFDSAQYQDVLLDNLINEDSSILLYQVAYIISMYKTANFCINKDSSKQYYVDLSNSNFSVLGDSAYNSRIVEPLSNELVWTDQDIEGTRQIIPIFEGVSTDTITFIINNLYSHIKKGE